MPLTKRANAIPEGFCFAVFTSQRLQTEEQTRSLFIAVVLPRPPQCLRCRSVSRRSALMASRVARLAAARLRRSATVLRFVYVSPDASTTALRTRDRTSVATRGSPSANASSAPVSGRCPAAAPFRRLPARHAPAPRARGDRKVSDRRKARQREGAPALRATRRRRPSRPILPTHRIPTTRRIYRHLQIFPGFQDVGQTGSAQEGIKMGTIDEAFWQPHHQPSHSPIGEIQMQVEPTLHQLPGITLEVVPFVVIGIAYGCEPRPRR